MLPILLALLTALCFAVSHILILRGLSHMDYFTGLVVNLVTNAGFLWLFLAVSPGRVELWVPANLIFVGAGLLVPGLSRFLVFKGLGRLGSSISATLVNSSSMFAILFAIAFLGERPTSTNFLGALSALLGLVSLSWRGEATGWRTRDLAFPVAAAMLFALRDNLVRVGLLITRSPVLGAAIAVTTSALTVTPVYFAVSGRASRRHASPRGALLFAGTGVLNVLANIFMFTALALDRVSIVSPLVNCYSVFVLPLAFFLLKDIERITPRKIGATLLVVTGVLLISWEKL